MSDYQADVFPLFRMILERIIRQIRHCSELGKVISPAIMEYSELVICENKIFFILSQLLLNLIGGGGDGVKALLSCMPEIFRCYF